MVRQDSHALHRAEDAPAHPTIRTYIQIALILTVITAVEVLLLYLPDLGVPVPGRVLVALFGFLSLAKFLLVVGWYMHLKFDPPMFRRIFTFALLVALTIATAYVVLFHGLHLG